MPAGYSKYLKSIYMIVDLMLLNLVFYLVSLYFLQDLPTSTPIFLAQFFYLNFCWIVTTFVTRIHDIERGLRYEQILTQLIRGYSLFSILMIALVFFLGSTFFPVEHLPSKLFVSAFFFLTWRSFMAYVINFLRRRGLNYRRVIIIGDGLPAVQMKKYFLSHPEVGFRLLGVFSSESTVFHPGEITGSVEKAYEYALNEAVDEIYCSLSGLGEEQVSHLMDFADRNLIRFRIIPDFRGFLYRRVRVDFFDAVPVLSVRNEPLNVYSNRVVKRLFDVVFSTLVLLLVFPIVLLIFGPLIKMSSKGPVFFKQLRSGKDNKSFACWKFRTMMVNEAADSLQAKSDDPRITKVGAFLRKTSMDELPQFYNALIGSMSVVGPRPHMLKHTEEYSAVIDKFMVRHFVKPGITGWAQVHGFRGETREPQLMEKRVEYDVWYIENWSLLLDLKIVVLTASQILLGKHHGG